jgi:membrane-bound lytic murein transglycosylase D
MLLSFLFVLLLPVITVTLCGKIFQQLNSIRYVSFVLVFLSALFPTAGFCNQSFPFYPSIERNFKFWEQIYSTYSLNDAVIHDSENLSRIYEVIPRLDPALPGAQRINRKILKENQRNYSNLLKDISISKTTTTATEKRVSELFKGPERYKRMERAAKNVRSQTGQKERFLEGVFRSRKYMKKMKDIFRSHNLPEDLAYLPHVESSFNIKAYSKFGAAGMWQFTRGTGKQYLTINSALDERLDPILATEAAARYLKNSYRALNNWPLAITSYNYGTAGMLRAVKSKGSYEKIFNSYNEGHFKFASKNFYSEFLAALKVAKKIEAGSNFKEDSSQSFHYLKLSGYMHVNHVTNYFHLDEAQIKRLNPALLSPVFNGEKLIPKGYSLRLPGGEETRQRINSIPSSLYVGMQKRSKFHRVKKGDTAGSIAELYGISTSKLKKANNLDKYATIYIRQKLRIPGFSTASFPEQGILQLKRQKEKQIQSQAYYETIPLLTSTKKNRPSTQHSTYIPPKNSDLYSVFNTFKKNSKVYGYITIQPEESLALYAQWLGSTVKKLVALHNQSPITPLEPGQKLLLVFDKLSIEHFEDKRLDYLLEIEEDFFRAYTIIGHKTYKVNSGDTFWELCYNKFDIPMWLLERYNSSINLSKLKSSQELIIPILEDTLQN